MNLTKKYRVVHIGTRLLDEQIEFEEGVITFSPKGATSVEFDFPKEAEKYITDNKLEYEYTEED